jgi:hypothetical protein
MIAAVLFQFSSRSGWPGSRREPAVKGAALRARADVQRCSWHCAIKQLRPYGHGSTLSQGPWYTKFSEAVIAATVFSHFLFKYIYLVIFASNWMSSPVTSGCCQARW